MKSCPYTLILMDKKGNIKWKKEDRKKRICFAFIDEMLRENWLQTECNRQDSFLTLIIHLQARPDYGLTLLRAGVRRDDKKYLEGDECEVREVTKEN